MHVTLDKLIVALSNQEKHTLLPHKVHLTNNICIGPEEKCFIIAELGQNHQGDLNIAKQMILSAKESGADCVKFQKSDLPTKFNKKALMRPYIGPNSWGDTYGAHKEFLEFSENDFIALKKFSDENNILFSSSAMDIASLDFLNSLNVPFIKIGSGDFCNMWLLKKAANTGIPLVVSTGMANLNEVNDAYNLLKSYHLNFCLLHCVSSYPTPVEDVNLNVIKTYKKLFPDINIGYSGHELGIDIPIVAVSFGAKIIEKHFTLNKNWKGTDHTCSLLPSEFKNMVQKIRQLEAGDLNICDILKNELVQSALGSFDKKFLPSENPCFNKLGKSVVAVQTLKKGDIITLENICVKVAEPKGIPGGQVEKILGKKVNKDIGIDESILYDDIS